MKYGLVAALIKQILCERISCILVHQSTCLPEKIWIESQAVTFFRNLRRKNPLYIISILFMYV